MVILCLVGVKGRGQTDLSGGHMIPADLQEREREIIGNTAVYIGVLT